MKKLIIFSFMMLVFYGNIFADFSMDMSPESATYNSLAPANFNPDHPELQPILFNLTINSDVDFKLICTLSYDDYPDAEIKLEPKYEPPYNFTANNQDVVVSNSGQSEYFDIDADVSGFKNSLEDDTMETGKIPDGNYVFVIEAKDLDGNIIQTKEFTLMIISPITISLVTPGNPLGSPMLSIYTQYPNFVWFSNLTDYTLKIYELAEIITSFEEITTQYEPFFVKENIAETSFAYPPSASSFSLGNYYAWYISAEAIAPSGTTTEQSIMYMFRFEETEGLDMTEQKMINFLSQLGYQELQQVIGYLRGGYKISNLSWKGEQISPEELNQILDQFLNNEINYQNLDIE